MNSVLSYSRSVEVSRVVTLFLLEREM